MLKMCSHPQCTLQYKTHDRALQRIRAINVAKNERARLIHSSESESSESSNDDVISKTTVEQSVYFDDDNDDEAMNDIQISNENDASQSNSNESEACMITDNGLELSIESIREHALSFDSHNIDSGDGDALPTIIQIEKAANDLRKMAKSMNIKN